ncbi:hypothetical protein POPTR_018G090350v4 [Populus trichocarpa]|uniref:Uncharacterized protein n=1 Tax=Populus trichocarpa TaxID=3694 RepID=A0ACC0RPU3_POPTR|nr:hypothetical protein POPTR_018G090350v4 [Populus trichocarpa]
MRLPCFSFIVKDKTGSVAKRSGHLTSKAGSACESREGNGVIKWVQGPSRTKHDSTCVKRS